MAKIMTILAMLMLAVSVLLGVIDTVNAVALAVAGGLVFAAIKFKVSAWATLSLCCLSGVTMAAGTTGDVGDWLSLIYATTANWSGWPVVGLGLTAVHGVAVLWVNITETPDDDKAYGRFYKKFIEPAAGILNTGKAKQLSFRDRYL